MSPNYFAGHGIKSGDVAVFRRYEQHVNRSNRSLNVAEIGGCSISNGRERDFEKLMHVFDVLQSNHRLFSIVAAVLRVEVELQPVVMRAISV